MWTVLQVKQFMHALHGVQVDCSDPHGNTLLSEAAAGGHVGVITLLLQRFADPNSRGEELKESRNYVISSCVKWVVDTVV